MPTRGTGMAAGRQRAAVAAGAAFPGAVVLLLTAAG